MTGQPGTDEVLRDWARELCRELGIDQPVGIDEILELAAIAAHRVARPAAPVTTFLVGYAAALRGGGAEHTGATARRARELAEGREP